MESPSKRQRLQGSFTPVHSSNAPSTASPTDHEILLSKDLNTIPTTLTPVSDAKPTREELEAQEEERQDEGQREDEDMEMREGEDGQDDDQDISNNKNKNKIQSDHNWHWDEPTAHPDAVSNRLNSSMGSLYKVISLSTPVRGYPHPSQNLISLYNLDSLATSVRRVDPLTGEKINKLRKSYEGKIKELHIAGRNKAASLTDDKKWFPHFTDMPEDYYQNMYVSGKELSKEIGLDRIKAACRIIPGPLPADEREKWKALLNIDEPATTIKQTTKAVRPANVSSITATSGAPTSAIPRPARTAKRSYNEASFEGYAEGYVDDEDMSDGTSVSGVARKKRRREENQQQVQQRSVGSIGNFLQTGLRLSH